MGRGKEGFSLSRFSFPPLPTPPVFDLAGIDEMLPSFPSRENLKSCHILKNKGNSGIESSEE